MVLRGVSGPGRRVFQERQCYWLMQSWLKICSSKGQLWQEEEQRWGPSFYSGSSRGELIGHRCQSENSLPTDTVEMLPDTHNPQAQPSMFTRQVTKHLSRSLSRGCVGWEMRPHGAHGMGRSLWKRMDSQVSWDFACGHILERPLIPGYKGSLISQFKDPKDEPQNSSTMESELS